MINDDIQINLINNFKFKINYKFILKKILPFSKKKISNFFTLPKIFWHPIFHPTPKKNN